jgi:hypothetical protein
MRDTKLQERDWNVKFLSYMTEKVCKYGRREREAHKKRNKNMMTEREREKKRKL